MQAYLKTRHFERQSKKQYNKMKEKVVLAFSGGLDTSLCVKYLLIEKNF